MDYSKAVAIAKRLIDKNGRPVDVQKLSSTVADVNKPWKGAGTPTISQAVSTKSVFLPVSSLGELGFKGVDEELLKRSTQIALVAGNAVDMTDFTSLLDGVSRWRIEWLRILKPGDTILLYAFGVSR